MLQGGEIAVLQVLQLFFIVRIDRAVCVEFGIIQDACQLGITGNAVIIMLGVLQEFLLVCFPLFPVGCIEVLAEVQTQPQHGVRFVQHLRELEHIRRIHESRERIIVLPHKAVQARELRGGCVTLFL